MSQVGTPVLTGTILRSRANNSQSLYYLHLSFFKYIEKISLHNISMKKITVFVFLLFSALCMQAQTTIKTDAETMGNALMNKDYETYVHYTYPKILKDMGGKEKLKTTLQQQMEALSAQGVKILSVTYGEPSVIIKEKNELQATIPQYMTFETEEGKVESQSTLIAISTDDGKHWYLIDPSDRDLETVRITLPNISKKLVLPANAPVKMLK